MGQNLQAELFPCWVAGRASRDGPRKGWHTSGSIKCKGQAGGEHKDEGKVPIFPQTNVSVPPAVFVLTDVSRSLYRFVLQWEPLL